MFCEFDFIGMTLEEIDSVLCIMENNFNGGHYGDRIEYSDAIGDLKKIVDSLWAEDEYWYAMESKF